MPKRPQQWTLHEEGQSNNFPEDEPGPLCSNVDPNFPELTVPHFLLQYKLNILKPTCHVMHHQFNP